MTSTGRSRLLRVPVSELESGEVWLGEQAARYAVRVHRLEPGQRFVVFDPAAELEADAELLRVDARSGRGRGAVAALVRVGLPRPPSVRAARDVTLVQGLAKGSKLDAIVRDATELGCTRIATAICERSVRRGSGRSGLPRRLHRIAVEAARQCGRGDAPCIDPPRQLGEVLDHLLPPGASRVGVCMNPWGEEALGEVLRRAAPSAAVVIVVGPEGGLSEAELAHATAVGYRQAHLGPSVLRTETVCAAALGAVLAWAPWPASPP
ncbi:MAG: RsmE family RNA methyltransferase [Deltaproteobacteria bacterium]|jgi:16S rRNA (uracil1498-N3)-methyltransferase|nr:RsmE family RNA methyltransferase [Deltaproteobacteria bacterium]MBW2532156.1 RsmE family RNA methyltransferase [Deltaproteobacteria bacterium]